MTLREVLDGWGKPLIIDLGKDTDDGLAVVG
jgi:hypothetical protein